MSGVVGRGLSKLYGAVQALDEVDLDVPPGTVHGLLGPNGAGKSTLLRMMLGLVRPDQGTLEVGGVVAGFVEVPGAYPYLTGRQNLEFLARLDDAPGDVSTVLEQVDLAPRADTKVSGWSLGMRQRLAIAGALLRAPDILLLDEPANGLDVLAARALRELVAGLATEGLTVILSSHDLAEVDALCEDATVLVSGRVAWTGSIGALRARPGRHRMSTSDDARAFRLAPSALDVQMADGALLLHGDTAGVDAYVLALGREQIAVRSLRPASLALEDAFLELTR
ncbi:MAG: transporter related [Frankiales bacterium]|nr:transporter related [Frankiales bacterium]